MSNLNADLKIIPPRNQIHLFGYEHYFKSFIKLYLKNELPNIILLSGPKGSGKATFIYHFINFLLSHNFLIIRSMNYASQFPRAGHV